MDALLGNWTAADWTKVQAFRAELGPAYGANLIRGLTLESLVTGEDNTAEPAL
jgi:hypothetical protein